MHDLNLKFFTVCWNDSKCHKNQYCLLFRCHLLHCILYSLTNHVVCWYVRQPNQLVVLYFLVSQTTLWLILDFSFTIIFLSYKLWKIYTSSDNILNLIIFHFYYYVNKTKINLFFIFCSICHKIKHFHTVSHKTDDINEMHCVPLPVIHYNTNKQANTNFYGKQIVLYLLSLVLSINCGHGDDNIWTRKLLSICSLVLK